MLTQLKPLVPYLRPYRGRMIAGIACVAGTAWVGLLAPWVIGVAIDQLRTAVTRERLLTYAAILVAINLVKGVFQFAQRRILIAASRDIERDLRDAYFDQLTRLDSAFFHRHKTGDLMARASNDLEAVRQICGPAIMYASNTVLTAVGALVFMFGISPSMTVLVLCTLPLIAVVTRFFGQRIHKLFGQVQDRFSILSSRVQENVAGSRVVRAYGQEQAQMEAFRSVSADYVEANRRLIRWNAAFSPLLQLVTGIGFALVLGYGGKLMLDGQLTIGAFVGFNLFLGKLTWPMIAIGWVINLITRGTASLARIQAVIDTEPAIQTPAVPYHPRRVDGAITFDHLRFAYDQGSDVLHDVDLRIAAGETLAVVGRTGAGKSTLLSLIPRLIDPPRGTLRIDDRDIRDFALRDLRRAIAMVPQETFLFSATLGENIAFGLHDDAPPSDDALRHIAGVAGLDNDLAGFPDGLDTLVGERGLTLSGGQKQRVALARALLCDPRILLLDDCLSAVDTETEETILRNLRTIFPGRTVLLVSHRVSAARLADRIVVLDAGKVAELGTHDALVERGGLYADLVRRQKLEDALAAV